MTYSLLCRAEYLSESVMTKLQQKIIDNYIIVIIKLYQLFYNLLCNLFINFSFSYHKNNWPYKYLKAWFLHHIRKKLELTILFPSNTLKTTKHLVAGRKA